MGLQTKRFNTGAGIVLATGMGMLLWAGAAFAIFAAVSN